MKFLRHLLGITKLDKGKNRRIREKNWSRELSEGYKTVIGKVAATRPERMNTNRIPKQALQYQPKGRRNIERPRDGGTIFTLRTKEQETRLTLHVHDDNDDEDDADNCDFVLHSDLETRQCT